MSRGYGALLQLSAFPSVSLDFSLVHWLNCTFSPNYCTCQEKPERELWGSPGLTSGSSLVSSTLKLPSWSHIKAVECIEKYVLISNVMIYKGNFKSCFDDVQFCLLLSMELLREVSIHFNINIFIQLKEPTWAKTPVSSLKIVTVEDRSYWGSNNFSSQIVNYFVLRSKLRFLLDHFVSKKGIRFPYKFYDASLIRKWKMRLENNEALISFLYCYCSFPHKNRSYKRLLLDQGWMGL